MLIIYDTFSGNTERFVQKLNVKNTIIRLSPELVVNEEFVLVTYTFNFGKVPDKTIAFLEKNHKYLKAVASSGNRNWGDNFAKAADIISNNYNVPIIHKFELSGTNNDIKEFFEGCLKHELYRIQQ